MNIKFLVLALSVALCVAGIEEAVVTIESASDLEGLIADNSILIEFYAPWCGHCKRLAPEFEKAANTLKDHDLKLAKVDCTAEGNKELCEKYDVKGFPTLKFFRDGQPTDYQGGREADDIVKYMLKKTGPSVTACEDEAAAQNLVDSSDEGLVVIQFAEKLSEQFSKVAEGMMEEVSFGSVTDETIAKSLGVSFPSVVLFRSFDEPTVVYENDVPEDSKAFGKWIIKNSIPLLGEIGPDNYSKYVNRGLPLCWVAFHPNNAEHATMLEDLRKVVGEFASEITVVAVDAEKFTGHVKQLGMADNYVPQLLITDAHDKYRPETKKVTPELLIEFLRKFLAGQLEKFLKSEPIPEDNDGPVKVIVGKTFEELVQNSDKDVLLEFYAPWCGHCKQLAPIYEELAEKFADNDKIMIAKVDATGNDTPIPLQGFPTIFLFSPSFDEPLEFKGPRTLEGFESFLAENCPSLKEDKEGEEEKEEHDEL